MLVGEEVREKRKEDEKEERRGWRRMRKGIERKYWWRE